MDYWIKRRRETEKALAERDLPGEAHASPPERAGAPIRPHRHAAEDRTRVYSGELLVLQLERSSLAQWLKEPVSRGTEKYYEAFRSVLDELPEDGGADRSPGAIRHRLVRQVGIGSPSTLYAVVQRRSFTGAIDEGDCKERLARAHVVTRLAAQAKLWFYRPFRLAWLEGLSRIDAPQGRLAARTLLHALISWVKAESQLACYSEYAPPLIAAQDLSQIVDGQLDFDDAMEFLGRVAERVATSALAIDALVEAAHGDLMSIAFDRPDAVRRSIDQLREPIQEILRSIGNLSSEDEALIPSAQREALRRLAASW
ncbi:hypothetical protein [Spirillospora sp. NPDC047279]|uniref:hypothetical protein n=1 Tax=Spirillospora sp. NPDC047279 TaxID=3155478 RepID=UPI0033F4E50A